MKLKVNWPALLRCAWTVVRQLIGGIAGGGVVSIVNGCSFYGTGIGYTS